jgi:hypothetical protein
MWFGGANNSFVLAGPMKIAATGATIGPGNIHVAFKGVISGNDLNVINYVNNTSTQAATVQLDGASPNTYSGGTTVSYQQSPGDGSGGHNVTVDAMTAGSLGTGNVTLNSFPGNAAAGTVMTLEMDVPNAIAPSAALSIDPAGTSGPGPYVINLNYTGTNHVSYFLISGSELPYGTYGAGANANQVNPNGTLFSGSGYLEVGPYITSETIVGNQLHICWTSVPGVNYNVLTTTSLNPIPTWTVDNGGTPVPGSGSGNTTCYTLQGFPTGVSGNPQVFVVVNNNGGN